jgi:photosystem II stability/assembly factor-like uncharacterized protein
MKTNYFLLLLIFFFVTDIDAQRRNRDRADESAPQGENEEPKSPMNERTFSGLKMRNIGPAFTSGRIADIAIHPEDDNVWYVAVGSGGVWKTTNAANTWKPVFDGQSVYSTGCVTIDPNNPSIIWVGTGENVGGRHVGFGDGIYRSMDGGNTWKNLGLKESQHISKIIIHPSNSNVVWVAVQGPLWNKGGERGFYKTTDGGETWVKTLGDEEWTGVTDIAIDPRDPHVIYAATWQRHRTIAAYMGGGPKSGIHKSMDGGETWTQLKTGLPGGNKGKIGLAISPQKPDIIYAAIELNRTKGGVYKSMDRGASWSKQSDAVSGATGPHYYQELYACPHNFDRLYLMDVRIQVSDNGGKNFRTLQERDKHSDNHAIAFRADDPDYLLVGTDAGIYESFDLAQNWRFIDNLPLTQYYKVAVDDREPFYHIFGGTQDNGSHGGPSRTDNRHGIRNGDWYKTLGADGHQSATEPGNPDIMYAETQQGGLHRVDLKTGEQVYIQPQPGAGEDFERFNWDAPIVVSPHNPARLYFASHRVWRSDNRGDEWTAISGDLTRDQERITLPIMGRVQSWDSPWDVGAMSNYNTISSLAESPIKEGLIYAGTDDGIIQVTEDGGANWRKIEVGSMPGVPATAFVNDIKADLFDANTVYVSMDNHKYGDFKPYLMKSTDKGMTWKSLSSNLPEKTLVWRLVQDHVKPNLMFIATEFGIYFTLDGGSKWIKVKGGVPTISFRDLTIQRRENDLIGASFGRGFFVLDDYSVLRDITEDQLKEEAKLFAVKDALWYMPRSIASDQGSGKFVADNPAFGATFTYHLAEGYETLASMRKKAEGKLQKNNQDIPFPGWDALDAEKNEDKPQLFITIQDADGTVVNRMNVPARKGMHRVAWDFRKSSKNGISLTQRSGGGGGRGFRGRGMMVTPGTYTASLSKLITGEVTQLSGPIEFNVVPLRKGTLKGASYDDIIAFRSDLENLQGMMSAFNFSRNQAMSKVKAMEVAVSRLETDAPDVVKSLYDLRQQLMIMNKSINGSESKGEIGERNNPSVQSRMFTGFRGLSTTYGPTKMHKQSLEIAKTEFEKYRRELEEITKGDLQKLEQRLIDLGAPWIEGQAIPKQ